MYSRKLLSCSPYLTVMLYNVKLQ